MLVIDSEIGWVDLGIDDRTESDSTPGLPAEFWRFWAASTVSNLGDGLRLVALPLLAATLTRDPLLVAGVSAFVFLPWIIVGPLSGVVVDRVDRRRLIIIVQLARGIAAAIFALTVATGTVNIGILYGLAVVIGVGETLADTASQAAIPRFVSPENLELANSRMLAGQIVANEALGTALGGVLFAAAAVLPFSVDAATYLIAAALVLAVRRDLGPGKKDAAAMPSTVRQDLVEGLRWLWRHDLLRPFALSVALINLGLQIPMALMVLFALDVLQLSEAGFGFLLAAGAGGGVLGASVANRVVGRVGRTRVLVGSAVITAGCNALIGVSSHPLLAGVALFLAIGVVTVGNVVGQSIRQAVTPSRLLGRVVGAYRLVGLSTIPIGSVVSGIIATVAGLRATFFVGATLIATAAWVQARVFSDHAISVAIEHNADAG